MIPWDSRALAVVERLEQAGCRAVLVGGCVRDSLLSRPPHDYDVATSALPDQVARVFGDIPQVPTGLRHGTITLFWDGLGVEVTTFRREGSYSDHRRPDRVEFTGTLEEDLARRDFTINAMAWDGRALIDPFGGREDLEAGLVRCVGDPERRFEEDALRPLRGLRLAAQLDFSIQGDTAAAIRRHAPQLPLVAWERLGEEFVRLVCAPGAGRVLLDFPESAAALVPELGEGMGFDQRNPHHRWDVYTHSVKALERVPPVPALRMAALLHDVGKPRTFTLDGAGVGHFYGHDKVSAQLAAQALERLRLPGRVREEAVDLVARHHLPVEPTRKWAGRWLSRLGEERLLELLALKRADALACAGGEEGTPLLDRAEEEVRSLLDSAPCLTLKDLAVDGRDALAAGLSGPAVGRCLKKLLEEAAQGSLPNHRDRLLEEMGRFARAENGPPDKR